MARISKERMLGVLGQAPKPSTVWQQQFDRDQESLRRLAQMDWDAGSERDLRCYIHDLAFVKLQPDLFRHVFPRCLKFWYDTLLENKPAQCGDAEFHAALIRGNFLTKMMSAEERRRLLDLFVDGLLDRLDLERDFVFERPGAASQAWIWRFNSLGIVAPIIPDLWRSWWAFDGHGQAVSAIKYVSGLIYLRDENPIYLPWTPDEGGGGPCLISSDASIYDRGWLQSNLSFLQETLTSGYVIERALAAASKLRDSPEAAMARRVAEDGKARADMIALRIDDLAANLARTEPGKDRWD